MYWRTAMVGRFYEVRHRICCFSLCVAHSLTDKMSLDAIYAPVTLLKGDNTFWYHLPWLSKKTSKPVSKATKHAPLKFYSDSDFPSDAPSRKSISGAVHILYSCRVELSHSVTTGPFNLRIRVHGCDYYCATFATVAVYAAISRFA